MKLPKHVDNKVWNSELQQHFGKQGPHLLLLDLDGTLIDSAQDLASAVDYMLSALGRDQVGLERVRDWVGNGADRLVRRALTLGDEQAALALDEQQVQTARQLFDQAYLSALHAATGAYPGIDQWLQQVVTPKVLITNKPRMFTVPLLESLGWTKHFVMLLCGDDLSEKKPSALPLLHACHSLNVATSAALMIGDSRNDIQAAQAANIASVAVTYGYNHGESIALAQPTWIVDRLEQLLA